ncbi:exo-beta-1,3-glucanase [Epithele typhae]|uniref:exo-beta-1,3-glucanase n=1 Tax=Epithele typhae TaxID=378194 RepID=UPI0020080B33|nr:exo-beta-1,3-glucanase [Epithele typhae]KAH9945948.1 exo-beta-1,3-glucanase [Epithele typhae]
MRPSAFLSFLSTAAFGAHALVAPEAQPDAPFWMESIKHQGIAPYSSDPASYQVFRNVKDFGAVGDGVADDTAAINAAISTGNRCGGGNVTCWSTTTTTAIIYFPKGTYRVTSSIQAYYLSQLIGDARHPPTIIADPNFGPDGAAVIDADPSNKNGNWYINQDNFFRSVRNLVIDTTQQPANATARGIHWQVSQATSLMNVVVNMNSDNGTKHQGLFMENGSGGFMGDIVFNGGDMGMWNGNQQFTVRNVTVNNAVRAIYSPWNWGWTYQGVTINNCSVGFDVGTGSVGSLAIIDAVVNDTPIMVRGSANSTGHENAALILNNVRLTNVPVAVGVLNTTAPVLAGTDGAGTMVIDSWAQGMVYTGLAGASAFTEGTVRARKPAAVLDGAGRVFGRTHPQYVDHAPSQFVSVRSLGAKGDGVADDTEALQRAITQCAGKKIIFVDAGVYYVSDTLYIPGNTQLVGEGWSVIIGGGEKFQDMNNPQPVIQVGKENEVGDVEITDIVFSTRGSAPGAIVMQWNIHPTTQGGAGVWDTHFRLGGSAGTNQSLAECPRGSFNWPQCLTDFLALHITSKASAYIEGAWIWSPDHDMDDPNISQLNVFSGRGVLSESQGPVWLIGSGSEHHVMYQLNLQNAQNHYIGLFQSETPYYQPGPAPPAPFVYNKDFKDPVYTANQTSSWSVNVESSKDIFVFGAGLYSFFVNYTSSCPGAGMCQSQILNIASDSVDEVAIFGLSTVGAQMMLSVDANGVVPSKPNYNGFESTITSWSSS